MSFFSRFTRKSGKSDDALYAQVWREVESKNVDEGLWARLWAENRGHEEKTKAAYLNERVKQLQEEGILKRRLIFISQSNVLPTKFSL